MVEVDAAVLADAVRALRRGGVIVYPTETFYGIGADATSEAAVSRVAALKGRDGEKPILVIASSREMALELVADVPAVAEPLIERFWPGPLTLVLRARSGIPRGLTAGGETVGVRVSSHPAARALAEAFGRPITATSANRGGRPPAESVDEARATFADEVDAYVDGGRSAGGLPSTVVDLSGSSPRILREGAISAAAIELTGMRLHKPARASS